MHFWSRAECLVCWCRKASLSGAKRKEEGSSTEGGSSDAAMLTSPRTSAAKSRARCKKEKKEEEEASNRVSHPLQDVEMQDPPYDEGEAHVVIETREVPAIKVERSRAEPSEGIRTPPTKEEAEEGDGTVSGKLVMFAKLA